MGDSDNFFRATVPKTALRREVADCGFCCAVAVAMSLVLAAVGIGTITAIYVCVRRALADAGPKKSLSEIAEGHTNIISLESHSDLDSLLRSGGKAVVYLTASW